MDYQASLVALVLNWQQEEKLGGQKGAKELSKKPHDYLGALRKWYDMYFPGESIASILIVGKKKGEGILCPQLV